MFIVEVMNDFDEYMDANETQACEVIGLMEVGKQILRLESQNIIANESVDVFKIIEHVMDIKIVSKGPVFHF